MYAFTGLVRLSGLVGEMSGVTHRVAELLECLRQLKPIEDNPQLRQLSAPEKSQLVMPEPEHHTVAFSLRYAV